MAFTDHAANCAQCGRNFALQSKYQLIALNCGRRVFCSDACGKVFDRNAAKSRTPHLHGPCPVCGKAFASRTRGRIYCSVECYSKSPALAEHLRALAASQVTEKEFTACRQCSTPLERKQKQFCSTACTRVWYANRFDRFVANPETIGEMQCFDEFLSQTELTCLFDGCNWSGKELGKHVNRAHGITADAFRKLVGFNAGTGLAVASVSKERAKIAKRTSNLLDSVRYDITKCRRDGRELRKEGTERGVKLRAMPEFRERMRTVQVTRYKSMTPEQRSQLCARAREVNANMPRIVKSCEECGADFAAVRSRFCGTKCRNAYYRRKRIEAASR